MSITKIFKNSVNESNRMDYDTFLKRLKEYMDRNDIDLNSIGMRESDMRDAYKNGKYPSKFVKSWMKNNR